MRSVSRVVIVVIVSAGLVVLIQLASAAPAAASCVLPPRVSTHPFLGTVIGVRNAGRTATVRTDDGDTVIVQGSPSDNPNGITTVDRTYQVGVRYEFHPVNDADPYQDNACTATHPIGPSSEGRPADSGDGQVGRPGVALVTGGVAVTVMLAIGLGFWLVRRRR